MGSRGAETQTQLTPTQVSDEDANLFSLQLVSGCVLPMVLKCAIELDLFEIIKQNAVVSESSGSSMSPSEIAAKLPTSNPDAAVMLDRILRLLASYSVLTCSLRSLPDDDGVERIYGLGPVCKYFTKDQEGVSNSPICVLNQDKVFMESWYHLKDAVLEGGIPFKKAFGMTAFEYYGTDQRFNKLFNSGMASHSAINLRTMLDTYKGFEGLGSIVDVGGGTGVTLAKILAKYPTIKGINFDLPHVIQDAPSYPGVEHVGGDMFVSVPKGDAILMKFICHDWSDAHCVKLLKNCYDALPGNGKVILAECILPVVPDSSLQTKLAVHLDCIMLANFHGGKERTQSEFHSLAKQAGFQGFQVVGTVNGLSIIELIKTI